VDPGVLIPVRADPDIKITGAWISDARWVGRPRIAYTAFRIHNRIRNHRTTRRSPRQGRRCPTAVSAPGGNHTFFTNTDLPRRRSRRFNPPDSHAIIETVFADLIRRAAWPPYPVGICRLNRPFRTW